MRITKINIILLFISVFIICLLGAYFGASMLQSNNAEEKEVTIQNVEGMEKVEQAYDLIEQNYVEDVEGNDLIEGAIQGMLTTLDEHHSTYMEEEAMGNSNEHIESSFQDIGTEVSMIEEKVTIIAPIKDTPAEKAGLKPNDQILDVDGEDIKGLDLNEAVEKIRGEKGSKVTLSILRGEEDFEVELRSEERR